MKLLTLFAGLLVLLSVSVSAFGHLRQPLKSTEIKFAACDVLLETYPDLITLKECKRMNSFVVEKVVTKIHSRKYVTGIGVELENKKLNCLLFANRDITVKTDMHGSKVVVRSQWMVEEDLRERPQGCIEL